MNDIIELQIWQFVIVYILLAIIVLIMKKCKINQTKVLIVSSSRMTIQLILAGLVLTYIFENPKPIYTVIYIAAMTLFAICRTLSKNRSINAKFKLAIALSMLFSGVGIVIFFVCIIVGESFFNPQYVIPISGMVMGNIMNGTTLAVKTFRESFSGQREKIEALLNVGVLPQKILLPFVNQSLETALLPTINSMAGMGIVSLPGMMTGQILSGTMPMTAILYQIAIMISVCTGVCLAVFVALYLGYKGMYNSRNQIVFMEEE